MPVPDYQTFMLPLLKEDAGKTVGKSGDGGIDGIINEDRLGLDIIYLQAKRWKENARLQHSLRMHKKQRRRILSTRSS